MNNDTNTNYGYTDWRMPNANEAMSIIDFSDDYPALADGHPFVSLPGSSDYLWTNTTAETDSNGIQLYPEWGGSLFAVSSKSSSSGSYLWAVRGGE